MTTTLLESLQHSGSKVHFVNKKFSRSISEVGRFSARKILLVGVLARSVWKACSTKPTVAILFATTRKGSFIVDMLLSEIIRSRGIPSILYIHTVGFSTLSENGLGWRFLVKRMFAGATKVVVLSEKLTGDLKPFVSDERFVIIGNCLSNTEVGTVPDRPLNPPNITFVSNLIPSKGALDFVHVAASVKTYRNMSFEIIGAHVDEAYSSALQLAVSQVDGKKIVLHGGVFGEDKRAVLERSRILVFPSTYRFEAQPLTLIEALQNGIPVVAYDTGGVSDIIQDGVEGFVVPTGDKSKLKSAVEKLANDDAMWCAMSKACRNKFELRFSRQAFDQSWKELVNEFC